MPAFARLPLTLFAALIPLANALPAGAAEALRRTAPAAPIRPEGPSTAWTSAESAEPVCTQSRRKLWRAGEGWTVRTVTTCR